MAVLPFENLSGDADLVWISQALPGILTERLNAAHYWRGSTLRTETDVENSSAKVELQGYFHTANGITSVSATLFNVESHKAIRSLYVEAAQNSSVISLANLMVLQFQPNAPPYPALNSKAVEQFYRGSSATSPEEAIAHLDQALQIEPNFATPYFIKAESLLSRGDSIGAREALAAAGRVSGNFSEIDRTRLAVLESSLGADPAKRLAATERLAALSQGDVKTLQNLGHLELAAHHYVKAVETLQKVVQQSGGDADLWNTIGYAYAYAGRLDEAKKALEEYGKRTGNELNMLDSLAEVYFYAGRFDEAEKYFLQAQERGGERLGAIELYRAGLSALFAGKPAVADGHVAAFLRARRAAKDPSADLREAIWLHQSGRVSEAFASARSIISAASGDAAALARTELAVWHLDAGERSAAAEEIRKALGSSQSAGVRNVASTVALMAAPSRPVEQWRSALAKLLPAPNQSSLRTQLLGEALLLDRQYEAAAKVWAEVSDTIAPDSSASAHVNEAFACAKSSNAAPVCAHVNRSFLPPKSPEPGIESLLISRALRSFRK